MCGSGGGSFFFLMCVGAVMPARLVARAAVVLLVRGGAQIAKEWIGSVL
jgi:hypothetical protein